jgi:glycosyltransferase involved in cell wall biosynthesis
MKSIDINGRFLTQTTTGVQRCAVQLVRELDRRLAVDPALRERYRFRLVTPEAGGMRVTLSLEHIPTASVGHLSGHAWEQLELPFHVGNRLVLNLCNTAPLGGNNVVIIHDASVFAVPEAYSPTFRFWYRTLLPRLGKRAVRIVTVSEFSRRELSNRAHIPPSKIQIIPQGSDHMLQAAPDPGIFDRVPVTPGGYLLTVGSRSPHKNMRTVVRAIAQLDGAGLPLLAVGGANPRVFSGRDSPGGEQVHSAGYVTDAELRALYQNAICLVFASLYEGFGLPALEAMACGCPAVVARAASLPEVCGDAVLYCNPRDPDDIARSIEMIQEPARRDELRRRGLDRARCFTWERAVDELLKVLDGLPPT